MIPKIRKVLATLRICSHQNVPSGYVRLLPTQNISVQCTKTFVIVLTIRKSIPEISFFYIVALVAAMKTKFKIVYMFMHTIAFVRLVNLWGRGLKSKLFSD
jgi:hypothetical protein